MKTVRRPTKSDILLNMFDEVGTKIKMEDVLSVSGIAGYNSLKAFFSYFRNSKHVAEESRIDVRINGDECVRIG